MTSLLFRTGVCLGLIGTGLGIFMGIRQDFTLVPVDAHLNLIGFVALFLSAVYYRAVPEAAHDRLARYHAAVCIVGAVLFPVGVAIVVLGSHDRFEPVVVAGALIVLLGKILFAAIVFRTSGGARRLERPIACPVHDVA